MQETTRHRQKICDRKLTAAGVCTVEAVGSEPGGGVTNEVISVY